MLNSLCEKLIKIGARVTSHGRYITFQLAEVAVSRRMFADILALIARLRAPPAPERCEMMRTQQGEKYASVGANAARLASRCTSTDPF
jgi:hypothetical protein